MAATRYVVEGRHRYLSRRELPVLTLVPTGGPEVAAAQGRPRMDERDVRRERQRLERGRSTSSRRRRYPPSRSSTSARKFFRLWFFAFCDEILWTLHGASA
jgi:hypothetical protein